MSNNEDIKVEGRTIETITKEYQELCARLGHAIYNSAVIGADSNAMIEQMKKLNEEATKLKKAQDEAAKKGE